MLGMSYQALYREWRSQRFDDLIGQQVITQTLKNAIQENKISHAYLFTGPRGTGKTSAAKILSKAINCSHSVDGEPCNNCDLCLGITEGRIGDVLEIDAASNNGVEEIRDIRDKVKYAPTQAPYKVYIIDEVHMLSTGAFNALLKTLEEPPAHVIFILATTEPHKIPATIISRTQRFDFKRIGVKDIESHLEMILKEKQIDYDTQVLTIVSRAAEGGMRDALSILDQVISFSSGHLTVKDAMEVTGSLTSDMMDDYIKACMNQDTEDGLMVLSRLLNEGKESNRIVDNLLAYCRDLLVYKQAPNVIHEEIGILTDDFKEISGAVEASFLYEVIALLNDTQREIKFSQQPTIYLEVMTIKATNLKKRASTKHQEEPSDGAVKELMMKLNHLENEVSLLKEKGLTVQQHVPEKANNKGSKTKQVTYRIPTEQVFSVLDKATKSDLIRVREAWVEVLSMLSVTQRAVIKASEPVAASAEGLILAFDYEILCQRTSQDQELQLALKHNLNRLIQSSPAIISVPKDNWYQLREDYLANKQPESVETPKQEKTVDPLVDEAMSRFGSIVEIIED